MSLLDNLPHRCTIFRQKSVSDGMGGHVYAVQIEQTGVECWEQQASASEIMQYEKRGINIGTKIYFVSDPGLTERHRILITSRMGVASPNLDVNDVGNPDVFDVMSVAYPDASAGLGVLFRAMCKSNTGSTN